MVHLLINLNILHGGAPQTINSAGSTATVTIPTGTPGTFAYSLISVTDVATGCSQTQAGTATVVVNPMPNATSTEAISTVCQNAPSPQLLLQEAIVAITISLLIF
ncbi:MAG: hypothetical protein R2779_10780 [Crocinitomicaceae bacterium]